MKPHRGFKVWQINECDWVWGRNFVTAVDAYQKDTGVSFADLFDGEESVNSDELELSDEDMDRLQFVEGDGVTERTFREKLSSLVEDTTSHEGFFASTEY